MKLIKVAVIPGYPRGLTFGASVGNRTEEGRELWLRYREYSAVYPFEIGTVPVTQEAEIIFQGIIIDILPVTTCKSRN